MTSTDSRVAFRLREDLAETFLGGIIRAGDRDVDLAELLEDGDGLIVLDAARDSIVVETLKDVPALEVVDAPEGAEPTDKPLEDLTAAALKERAAAAGITGVNVTKPVLVDAITERNAAIVEGRELEPEELDAQALANAHAERQEA